MPDSLDLLALLRALPEINNSPDAKPADYQPLDLAEGDLPRLLEIAKPNSPIFKTLKEDAEDDAELLELISASYYARAIITSFDNPAHFAHFYQWLLEAENADDEGYYVDFSWFISQLGPEVIDWILVKFAEENQTLNTKQSLAEALSQFAPCEDKRARIVETLRHGFDYTDDASFLNPQLIKTLIDFKGVEAIEEITALDNRDLLLPHRTGDLEEIKIGLGILTERETSITSDEPGNCTRSLSLRKVRLGPIPKTASSSEIVDHLLSLYQSSGSITNHSELKGYFAATSVITPLYNATSLTREIWSGHDSGTYSTPWLCQEDGDLFHEHAELIYRSVFAAVNDLDYTIPADLPSWSRGFLLGMKKVEPRHKDLAPLFPLLIAAVEKQDRNEISSHLIAYTKRHLEIKTEQHAAVGRASVPVKREAPKIKRNSPCPCGSGKKHKKCCG